MFAQRFSASGNRINDEFRVNTLTTDHQSSPDVASDGVGDLMVVWASSRLAPAYHIVGRAYSASAGAFGPEFVVSSNVTRFLGSPAVSTDIFATQFVVAWSAIDSTNEESEVVSRRLDATGTPFGAAFQVNTYTTGYQRQPVVAAALASGGSSWPGRATARATGPDPSSR